MIKEIVDVSVMKKYKFLTKYQYFNDLNEELILDSLTGTVSRKYIIEFVKELIENKISFTLSILDLDNFKLINDNYGHQIGDDALLKIGQGLIEYVGERGVVGRYGGDEFVIVYVHEGLDYVVSYNFLKDIFSKVLRHNYNLGNKYKTMITGTIGSAIYPNDSNEYEDLFLKADKALYRGKIKGRNCFIVYVDKLHKDIDLKIKKQEQLPKVLDNIFKIFCYHGTLDNRIKTCLSYVCDNLMITGVTFIKTNGDVIFSDNADIIEKNEISFDEIDTLLNDRSLVLINDYLGIKDITDIMFNYCERKIIKSLMISQLIIDEKKLGYLFFTENRIERIWQQNDEALMVYLSKMICLFNKFEK